MRTELFALFISASATSIGAVLMLSDQAGVLAASAVSLSVIVAGLMLAVLSDGGHAAEG